jgi:acetyl esterase/lipase
MDVSGIARKWLDIPYASLSPAQRLDIYLPRDGDGLFPILLAIHGGAFAVGDKRDLPIGSFLRGLERGYALVSLNYRLSREAVFPAGIQDVKAAIRWLRANGTAYLLDASRIAACGASSGGNYAAMIGVTEGESLFDDPVLGNPEQPAGVQVVIDWFGPTDFLKMDDQLAESGLWPRDHNQPDSPESLYLGAPIQQIPRKVQLANPMTFVSERMPPILIQHGDKDCLVPVQQSIEFARVIEQKVGADRLELDILADAGHDDPKFHSEANMDRVFDFIDRYLQSR